MTLLIGVGILKILVVFGQGVGGWVGIIIGSE